MPRSHSAMDAEVLRRARDGEAAVTVEYWPEAAQDPRRDGRFRGQAGSLPPRARSGRPSRMRVFIAVFGYIWCRDLKT